MRSRSFPFVVLLLLLAVASPVRAGGARQMHEAGAISFPGTVNVTRALFSDTSPTIYVSLPTDQSVVIDLCGHEVRQGLTNVPVVYIGSGDSVTIKNGTLRGGLHGVEVGPLVARVVFENVKIVGAAQDGVNSVNGSAVTLAKMSVNSVGRDGVRIHSADITKLDDVLLEGTGGVGLSIVNVTDIKMSDLRVMDSGSAGLSVNNVQSVDLGDTFIRGGYGADLDNVGQFHISRLKVDGAIANGLTVSGSDNGKIDDALIANAGADGIALIDSNANIIRQVDVRNAQGNGVSVDATSSNNVFEFFSVTAAVLDGVLVNGTRNVLVNLTSLENGGSPVHLGPNAIQTMARMIYGDDPINDEGSQTTLSEIFDLGAAP